MKIVVEVETPTLPNYVRLKGISGASVDVATLSESDLKAIGEQWTLALIAHANHRKGLLVNS